MKNKILSFLLVALASTSYAQEATPVEQAQGEENKIPVEQVATSDEADLDTLEDYEVTAYRFGTPQLDTPVNTTVITADDIAESFSTNIADVLQKKANVLMNSTSGNPIDAQVSMRGFGENSQQRVLVIIDGQRINRPDMGTINWTQIPLEYIDSIEVMRGSQSAMYGNNAVAGVIKITTKKGSADDIYSTNFSYGSYNTYNVNGFASGSVGNWFYSADVGRQASDGYRDNSDYWTNSYNVTVGNHITDAVTLTLTANYAESEYGQPGGISWDQFYTDPTISNNLDDRYAMEMGTYTLALNSDTDFGEGEVALSGSFYNRNMDMVSWWKYTEDEFYNIYFTPKYKFKLSDEANVFVGVDVEYIDVTTNIYWDSSKSYQSSLSNIERYSLAPYIGGDYKLDNFIFTAAARYEFSDTSADITEYGSNVNDSSDHNGWGANVGITYKLNENQSVYFRFDQIYRYPSLDEIASYSGYGYVGYNPSLKPEEGQNYEVGYKYYGKKWSANANFFLQYLKNEIAYDWTSPSYNSNLDPTMRYGFDYQIAYDDKYWGASLMGSLLKAEFDGGYYAGNDVPLVPNYNITAAVYVKPLECLRLGMTYSYVGSSYGGGDNGNDYTKSPSYGLLGFSLEYKFTKYSTLYLGIDNALDKDYVAYNYYSSIYAGMGRVFKAGLNLTF